MHVETKKSPLGRNDRNPKPSAGSGVLEQTGRSDPLTPTFTCAPGKRVQDAATGEGGDGSSGKQPPHALTVAAAGEPVRSCTRRRAGTRRGPRVVAPGDGQQLW
jgi:hypothetical protein